MYWTKKSNYNENRNQVENTIKIYNKDLKKWETIKLSDYMNSFIDIDKNLEEKLKLDNTNLQHSSDLLVSEIHKVKNLQNITEEKDEDEKRIEKLYNIIEDIKERRAQKATGKQQGEK